MENPAKFMRQNKGRDMDDETMKALANDILAKCQEQELSYTEMRTLILCCLAVWKVPKQH